HHRLQVLEIAAIVGRKLGRAERAADATDADRSRRRTVVAEQITDQGAEQVAEERADEGAEERDGDQGAEPGADGRADRPADRAILICGGQKLGGEEATDRAADAVFQVGGEISGVEAGEQVAGGDLAEPAAWGCRN